MPGFTSPSILFLNTADSPERAYCKQLFAKLRDSGYNRLAEPSAGAFGRVLTARDAGWDPSQLECSDIGLFSSVVGSMLDPQEKLEDLGVRLDGEAPELPAHKTDAAAYLLWLQLLARMQARPPVDYWRSLVEDLTTEADYHRRSIAKKLAGLEKRIGGISYKPMDLMEHAAQVRDDPHAILSCSPPSWAKGYEQFYDTKGRLTWKEPSYGIWDPDRDLMRLQKMMEGAPALLLCQEQREPRHATHPQPVFARHLSLGAYIYIVSNRPDEVFELMGGPKVALRRPGEIFPADVRTIDPDYPVNVKSRLEVMPVKQGVADYYRELWMHRLAASPGSYNMLVLVDGYAAGVLGYSVDPIVRPYSPDSRYERHILMRFAFGAPHDVLRLRRLATMVCLQKATAAVALGQAASLYLAYSEGLVTMEYTRQPESKGLRGLMKFAERKPHPDGWQLTYAAPWQAKTLAQVLAEWLRTEERWRKQSAAARDKEVAGEH